MFGISGIELFLILLFGFLIFGPDKLPAIAKTIGKGIAKFREAQQDMNDVIKNDVYDPSNPDAPFKDPTVAFDKLADTAEKHIKGAASDAKTAVNGIDLGKKDSKAKGAGAASEPAAAQSATQAAAAQQPAHQESFTERKARYERERAAKKAEEEKKAHVQGASGSSEGGAE